MRIRVEQRASRSMSLPQVRKSSHFILAILSLVVLLDMCHATALSRLRGATIPQILSQISPFELRANLSALLGCIHKVLSCDAGRTGMFTSPLPRCAIPLPPFFSLSQLLRQPHERAASQSG